MILVGLFAFAAAGKLAHFGGFIEAVRSYRLLPAGTERFAATFVVMAEVAIALGLLTKRWRQPACLAAALLLAAFTAVYLLARPQEACGSWYTLTLDTGGPVQILRNIIFIGLAALTWLDNQTAPSVPGVSSALYPLSHSTAARESDDGRLRHVRWGLLRTFKSEKEVWTMRRLILRVMLLSLALFLTFAGSVNLNRADAQYYCYSCLGGPFVCRHGPVGQRCYHENPFP
jgi:hypothetical protein